MASNELAREAQEETDFHNVLGMLNNSKEIESSLAMALIQSYLGSPKNGVFAQEIAIDVLAHLKGFDQFQRLLNAVLKYPDITTPSDIATISRHLIFNINSDDAKASSLQDRHDTIQKNIDVLTPQISAPDSPGVNKQKLQADLQAQKGMASALSAQISELQNGRSDVLRQIQLASDALAGLLKSAANAGARSATDMDLHGAELSNEDLRNVSFKGADLSDVIIDACQLKGADLSNIKAFDSGNWQFSAWWTAKSIDRMLLQYLLSNFQFDATKIYADQTDAVDFKAQVERLQEESAYSGPKKN